MSNYPLASNTWDKDELAAIQQVIDSGMFTMGKHVADYEHNFAEFFGSNYAVMVNSGSTANLLMIAAMFYTQNKNIKLKRGDEVIVPAVSWSTTYFPLQQYGLKVKFVDIDEATLNINLESLEKAITPKTKAIFLVNLLGNPNDFDEIKRIIDGRNITVLEDNCESMGAQYKGKYAGTFGLMGSFSSFFSHHIATMEGGCIVTDDEEFYHILLCLRAHGWTRDLPKNNHIVGEKSDDWFEESFRFVLPGYNVRPLEMSGAIGIEQLKKLPNFIHVRQQNALYFQVLFKDHPYIRIQSETGSSSWFGFSLIIKDGAPFSRADLVNVLKENKIDCRPIVTGNFVKNIGVLEHFDYEVVGDLINAEELDKSGLFVGNQQTDITSNILFLFHTIQSCLCDKNVDG